MALTADGWHMGMHVAVLTLTGPAYVYARRAKNDTRFAYGPWKIEALGSYTSALFLGAVSVEIIVESIERLREPLSIHYSEAMLVAALGLVVNLASAWLLGGHEHGQAHGHSRDHGHSDHNLRAAYLHVLADAVTLALAIVALLAGKLLGWAALDSVTGIVGGVVIGAWAIGLLRDTSRVLLDREMAILWLGISASAWSATGRPR